MHAFTITLPDHCHHCWFVIYLNFANPDKVSILLNNVGPFQGATILEPAEGGRWDSYSRALQLQRAAYCYCLLLWGAGAGYLWRLCIRKKECLAKLFKE